MEFKEREFIPVLLVQILTHTVWQELFMKLIR